MSRFVYRWTTPGISEAGYELLKSVVTSGQWSYGPIARHVEREIAADLAVKNVLLTNSGTSALWILLAMLRDTSRQQSIIVPGFGYSAAANVAAMLGYSLLVADSKPNDPTVDPTSVERLIDDSVSAIICINYFGHSVDWDNIPRRNGITIIEDAAGSYGATYKGRASGSNADLSIMSFHTSKAAAAGGEGGCIIAKEESVLHRARAIARSGHVKGYYYAETLGMNMLMTDVAACFLNDTLQQYQDTYNNRQEAVLAMDAALEELELQRLDFNHSSNERTQNYQTFATLVKQREIVVDLMRIDGYEVRPCWPFLINDLPATKHAVKKIDGQLEHARRFSNGILNLPVNPFPAAEQIGGLVAALNRAMGAAQTRSGT